MKFQALKSKRTHKRGEISLSTVIISGIKTFQQFCFSKLFPSFFCFTEVNQFEEIQDGGCPTFS